MKAVISTFDKIGALVTNPALGISIVLTPLGVTFKTILGFLGLLKYKVLEGTFSKFAEGKYFFTSFGIKVPLPISLTTGLNNSNK